MSDTVVRQIIQAVAVDGFKPRLVGDGLHLEGSLDVSGTSVPMEIRFADLTLAGSPRCFLPDPSMLGRKVVPHLDDKGEYCVVDRNLFVFDRYRAPEQTRGLIVRAKEVLERGMTKAGTDEIADEFLSYWSDSYLNIGDDTGSVDDKTLNLATVTTHAKLSFEAHQDKPATLGAFLEWARFWDKDLERDILAAYSRLSAADPMVEVHAANVTMIGRILVSAKGSTFVRSLARHNGWQRYIVTKAAHDLKIERIDGRRTDFARIFGMNGPDGAPPLRGKTIVLIGCGAIGGYLSRMLTQNGAGLDARLILTDPDSLDRPNIRRHQLGLGSRGRKKAEACAETITRDFPGIHIVALGDKAERHPAVLAEADLVIDATGEQEFSDWLNHWGLSRRVNGDVCPALLFVWIAGHGAAAQSFLVADDDFACYRCLQPDLTARGRFDPLKDPLVEPVAPCGEQPFTRYGPAASTAAASLASSHAVDWALGHSHYRLRTTRIDWDATVKRDPKSPDKASHCPACGRP